MLDETHDEQKSQGWTALVLDTNGNGKRDAYVEPEGADRSGERQADCAMSSIASTRPRDGSIWGSVHAIPGSIIRLTPGPNPTETSLAEVYEVPCRRTRAYAPRGMDIDRNGVAWVALGSGHLASFDRRKCKGPLNGPKATGHQCAEGWTFYAEPLPQFKNVKESGSAEASYFAWVDQRNTFGLGDNTPIATGNESDGFLALQGWQVGRAPRAVSDGHLLEGHRRPHRRSEGWLERARPLDDDQHAHAVPHGDRQGNAADRDALSVATGSTRQIKRPGPEGTRPTVPIRQGRAGPFGPASSNSFPYSPSPPGALPRSPS